MLKVLGCIMLFFGCTALGFAKAETYKQRRLELCNALEVLRLLKIDMTYKKETLQKSFKHLYSLKPCWFTQTLNSCADNLAGCSSVLQAWEKALEERGNAVLKTDDIVILQDVFNGLGKSDIKGQESIFEPAIIRLQGACEEAVLEEKKQGRMFRCLGSFAGFTIVILLI